MKSALIDAIWHRLPRIARLEFQALPGTTSGSHWQGRGTADVQVESTAGTIRFIESGQFWPRTSSTPVSVRNVYRWQREGQSLLLSHERLGRNSGVFLSRFTQTRQEWTDWGHTVSNNMALERADPKCFNSEHSGLGDAGLGATDQIGASTDPGTLEGSEPHQCGQDQYRATLRLTDDGIRLDWVITGPRKDERLVQQYGMGMRGTPG